MKRMVAFLAAFLLLSHSSAAQTLPELFQKAKAQVKGESWKEALKTLEALESEAGKPENESARDQLAAPVAFYRGVCQANLGDADKAKSEFTTFLQLQPNAAMDPSMYSKKAVAAFESARSAANPPDAAAGPSMFSRFQEFKQPANSGEQVNEKWADGPVKWLMTSAEKRKWAELTPGAEWQEFVDRFWEDRNPQPGSAENTFRTGFERRVAFADASFVQAEGTRGSMTDRGMVFVLLGPPTYVGRKPIRAGDDSSEAEGMSTVGANDARNATTAAVAQSPSGRISSAQAAALTAKYTGPGTSAIESSNNYREVWHYRRELLPKGVGYQQVDVEFITKKGYGVNVMQRDQPTLATLEASKPRRAS